MPSRRTARPHHKPQVAISWHHPRLLVSDSICLDGLCSLPYSVEKEHSIEEFLDSVPFRPGEIPVFPGQRFFLVEDQRRHSLGAHPDLGHVGRMTLPVERAASKSDFNITLDHAR